jgi:hypothetical protein
VTESNDTESNDPTGMWAMAGKIHEMAVRRGAVQVRQRPDPDSDAEPSVVFADWFEQEESISTVSARNGGWVPDRATVEAGRAELTPLDTPAPTVAARMFPSMEDRLGPIRRSWPDGDEPIFDEVDADVTHPRTPTGKLAKCGPKLPFTDGLSFDEFVLAVKEDLRRVDARYHLGRAGLIDSADENA